MKLIPNLLIKDVFVGTRFRKTLGDISKLMESIKERGLIHPVVVHPIGTAEGKYGLLAGGRRLEACRKLGWTEIPVRVYEEKLTEDACRLIELEENTHREKMTWKEECELIKEIHDLQLKIHGRRTAMRGKDFQEGATQLDTAAFLNKSPAHVSGKLKLAEAIALIPELGTVKTETEALQILKALARDANVAEAAAKIQETLSSSPKATQQKRLMDSYIVADATEALTLIESRSINIVEMDPPYAIAIKDEKKRKLADDGATRNYTEIKKEDYPQFLKCMIDETYRVLKDDGWFILWFAGQTKTAETTDDNDPYRYYHLILNLLEDAGFKTNGLPCVWTKPAGQTHKPDIYLGSAVEFFLYARKGNPKITKQGRSNVFDFKPVPAKKKVHITERPIEMIQEVLATFGRPGDIVCVPCCGSGNTLLAACNLGMSGFGYDLSQECKNDYILKVKATSPGNYKSYIN